MRAGFSCYYFSSINVHIYDHSTSDCFQYCLKLRKQVPRENNLQIMSISRNIQKLYVDWKFPVSALKLGVKIFQYEKVN